MKNVFDFGFDFPGMNSEPDVFCSTFSSSGDFGFGSPFQGSSAFAESRTSSSDTGNLVGACAAAGLAAAFGAAAVHHMMKNNNDRQRNNYYQSYCGKVDLNDSREVKSTIDALYQEKNRLYDQVKHINESIAYAQQVTGYHDAYRMGQRAVCASNTYCQNKDNYRKTQLDAMYEERRQAYTKINQIKSDIEYLKQFK